MLYSRITPIEKNLLDAIDNNNFNDYIQCFEEWKKAYQGTISSDRLGEIFLFETDIIPAITRLTLENADSIEIAKHILDTLENSGYSLNDLNPYEFTKFLEKLEKFSPELLEHPLVKKASLISIIKKIALNSPLKIVKSMMNEFDIKNNDIFDFYFADTVLVTKPDDRDKILAELLSENMINICNLNNMLIPLKDILDPNLYPLINQTKVASTLSAINLLDNNSLDAIDEYLAEVEPHNVSLMATNLLSASLSLWCGEMFQPYNPLKEKIILKLLDTGAQIPFICGSNFYLNTMGSMNMLRALKHNAVMKRFKQNNYGPMLNDIIKILISKNPNVAAITQEDADLIELYCSNAPKNHNTRVEPLLDVQWLLDTINSLPANPQYQLKMLGSLFKHELIADMDSIQPGSHQLNIINPQTNQAYDLCQFIMDNKDLNKAYQYQRRNKELLSLYALDKALLWEETRDKDLLDEVLQESEFMITDKNGNQFPYNLYYFKNLLSKVPAEMRAAVLKKICLSSFPEQLGEIKAMNLDNIAKQSLNKNKF